MTCLIQPLMASTICSRSRYRPRPAAGYSFATVRCMIGYLRWPAATSVRADFQKPALAMLQFFGLTNVNTDRALLDGGRLYYQ